MKIRAAHLVVVFCILVLSSCKTSSDVGSPVVGAFKEDSSLFAMFHPYDPTLQTIAERISEARSTVDIAMYNLDVTNKSPFIQKLSSPVMQHRIKFGDLRIRLIFEGYKGKEDAKKRSKILEELGVDVRWLHSGRKVHHKFAVIDAYTETPDLITGSANWSLSSRNFYNEVILFMAGKPSLSSKYQKEFNLLWSACDEFGQALVEDPVGEITDRENVAMDAFFNSDNFKFNGTRVSIDKTKPGYRLTREIVEAIDGAKEHIKIATTRIKLRPIFEAIISAAKRGVKIDIIVNMDQYAYKRLRDRMELGECENFYDKDCSTSKNFSHFLTALDYEGKENVSLKIKFFNLTPSAYITKQMHSKYFIVDDEYVWSGSFNWSYSAEYSHIENITFFDGAQYPVLLEQFLSNFNTLSQLGDGDYDPFIARLESAFFASEKTECKFAPMVLTFDQIDYLLNTGNRHGKSLKSVCK